jgi:hypothetical protein
VTGGATDELGDGTHKVRIASPKERLEEWYFILGRAAPTLTKKIHVKTPICLGIKTNFLNILGDRRDTLITSIVKLVENDEKKVDPRVCLDGGKEIGEVYVGWCIGLRIPDSYDSDVWGRRLDRIRRV